MTRRNENYRNRHGELLEEVNRRRTSQGDKPLSLPETIARDKKIREHLRFRKRLGLSPKFLKLPADYRPAEHDHTAPSAEQAGEPYWVSD